MRFLLFKFYKDIQTIKMKHLWQRLQSSLIQLSLCSAVNSNIYIVSYTLAVLQIISAVTHPQSNLHLVFFWTDPSNYLPNLLFIVGGIILTLLISGVILYQIVTTQLNRISNNDGLTTSNFGTFSGITQQIMRTLILTPSIRSSVLELKNPENSVTAAFAGLQLSLFLLILYPALVYVFFSNNALSVSIRATLRLFNPELLLAIFAPIFAISSTFASSLSLAVSAIFLILFIFAIVRTPIIGYRLNNFRRSLPAAVAAACIIRLSGVASSNPQGAVFTELLTIIGIISASHFVSQARVKQVLGSPKLTIHQAKTLIYFASNLKDSQGEIQYFLLRHRHSCIDIRCNCVQLIQHMSSRGIDTTNDTIWFQFLAYVISKYFNIQEIITLPHSQMKLQTEKYRQIVFDLAEIYLFKLKKLNMTERILDQFQTHLETQAFPSIWNNHKGEIVKYHLQKALRTRYRQTEEVNIQAGVFQEFQLKFGKIYRLFLRSGSKVQQFWTDVSHREPDQSKIKDHLHDIYDTHLRLRELHRTMTQTYSQAKNVLDEFMSDYCKWALEAAPGEPCHFLSPSENSIKKNKGRVQRLSEDAQCFSYDSETPLCFVSALGKTFGKIMYSNIYFQEAQRLFGSIDTIQDLLPPELRDDHSIAMLKLIESDGFSSPHPFGFLFTDRSQLLSARILVQIAPSIIQGLRYAVYFKRIDPSRIIFAVKNLQSILYTSKYFDSSFDLTFSQQDIMESLSKHNLALLSPNNKVQIRIEQEVRSIVFLHKYEKENLQIIFLELFKDFDRDEATKLNGVDALQEDQKRTSINQKSIVLNQDSEIRTNNFNIKQVQKEKQPAINQIQDQTEFRERKINEKIKQTFNIIDDQLSGRKNRRKVYCIVIIIGTIAIGLIFYLIFIKIEVEGQYEKINQTLTNYNHLMMVIASTSIQLKQLNLALYQNQSNSFYYQKILNASNIINTFDKVVSYFEIDKISEDWTYLQLNSSNIFINGSESFFKFMPDFLQNPLTNLQNTPMSNFNFSFSKDYLTSPLTLTQIQFHTFLTNAIYFFIPNLRKLWQNKLALKLIQDIQLSIPFLILINLIVVLAFIGPILTFFVHRRVVQIKEVSHRILEALSSQEIQSKIERCQNFLQKYNYKKKQKPQIKTEKIASIMHIYPVEALPSATRNISSTFEQVSERELKIQSAMRTEHIILEKPPAAEMIEESEKTTHNRRKKQIFNIRSRIKLFLFYFFLTVPFMSFSVVFIIRQIEIQQQMNKHFQSVYGMCYYQQNMAFIHLYALHFGVYNVLLQSYFSIGKSLIQYIFTMFYVVQGLIKNLAEDPNPSELSSFLLQIRYRNLCEVEQTGVFDNVSFQFEGRGNRTFCELIDHGILTKGFFPALLSYIQKANNLFTANANTVMYSPTQKLEYLNNSFFTDTVRIKDYMTLITQYAWEKNTIVFYELINGHRDLFVNAAIAIIIGIMLFILVMPKIFIKGIEKDAKELKSIFTLVSYQTIMNHPELKQDFIKNIDNIEELK